MDGIILHHFDISPFAEKVKLALGLKGLQWRSVQIPLVMPKPDLTALTGGYRKTPVMQIGADVYCDTRRIVTELEARFPGPSLFPGNSRELSFALAYWSDSVLFEAGAGLSLGTNDELPETILDDRMAFFDFLVDRDLALSLPHLYGTFRAGLEQLDAMLRDGRPWLTGDLPSWADLACYSPVWMCRANIAGASELLEPLPHLVAWEKRVAAFGHGERAEMDAGDALEEARTGKSVVTPGVLPDAWPRVQQGQQVEVCPADYGKDPVQGELLRLTHEDIAIARDDARAGRVVVHFPRAGYRVDAL